MLPFTPSALVNVSIADVTISYQIFITKKDLNRIRLTLWSTVTSTVNTLIRIHGGQRNIFYY